VLPLEHRAAVVAAWKNETAIGDAALPLEHRAAAVEAWKNEDFGWCLAAVTTWKAI